MAQQKVRAVTEEPLNQSEAFFMKYKKAILTGVAAILVIIAGAILYYNYVFIPEENEASTALARGEQYMEMGDFEHALKGDGANYKGFIAIANNYSSTDAGNLANLYAGLCYAHMQKPDWKNALKYVKEFDTSDDMIISPASQMALSATSTPTTTSSTMPSAVSRRLLRWLTTRLPTIPTTAFLRSPSARPASSSRVRARRPTLTTSTRR